MDSKVTSALIAGGVSFLIAIISYITTVFKVKHDNKKLELELKNKYTEKIYERRLALYPEAFVITDKLGKNIDKIKEEKIPSLYLGIEKELRKWKSGEVNLILSESSINAYYTLLKCFKSNPALGSRYNKDQYDRFYSSRTKFRNCLREDIGLLYELDGDDNG